MKKTIYLNKDYTIDDINEISDLMNQKDYDIIDYSNCNVDEYIKILLDNYNSKYFLSNYSSEKNSLLFVYNIILNSFSYLFDLIFFCKILFKNCDEKFQRKYFYNNVIADIFDMAMDSIPVIIVFSLAFGFNLSVQTVVQLKVFSSMEFQTMNIVTIAFFKGMGLFIALVVLSSKYASGLIAKVGFMKITDEWNALKLMNVDPEIFFLKSKILAFIMLVPLCSYISILFGIIGAFIGVSYHLNVSYKLFVSVSELTFMMFLAPLIKGLVIGVVLGIVSSYEAFNVKNSSDEILFALSRGVVTCIVLCIIVDLLLNFGLRSFI